MEYIYDKRRIRYSFSMYYIQQGIPSCILLPVLWGIIPLYLLYNSMRNRLNQYLVLF